MTGNGYTKQGTSSPAIACKTTVAKSSFSGNKTFYPAFWGTDSDYVLQWSYITLLFMLILFNQTYMYIYFLKRVASFSTLYISLDVYLYSCDIGF
jgi:hypothetical protein